MAKRIYFIIIAAFFLLLMFDTQLGFAATQVAAPDPAAKAALLMDADSGQVLLAKNGDQRMYPASTTKIITALIALEKDSLKDLVKISENAAQVEGSRVGLQPGEQIKMEHLLYMMLLNSANDAAVAIAEHLGGSEEGFARMMNQRAKQLGANDTNFVNPHGMPDQNHYSTAHDLALIGREAMQNQGFAKIAQTLDYHVDRKKNMDAALLAKIEQLERTYGPVQEDFFNQNKLLWHNYYGYRGATGIKTGYTSEAGMCLVACAQRQGRSIISVVLQCQGDLWRETAKLLDYGFDGFTRVELIRPDEIITDADVKFGAARAVLETADYLYYNVPVGQQLKIERRVQLKGDMQAPLPSGAILGNLVLAADGQDLGRVPLTTVYPVTRKITTYWWFWVATVLFLAALIQLLRWRRHRRRPGKNPRMDPLIRVK